VFAVAVAGLLSLPAPAEDGPRLQVERAERIEAILRERKAARQRSEQQTREALGELAAADPQAAENGAKLLQAGGTLAAWQDDAEGRAARAYDQLPNCQIPAERAAVRRELVQAADECEQLEPLQDEVNAGLRQIMPPRVRTAPAEQPAGHSPSIGESASNGDDVPAVPDPVVVAQQQPKGPTRFHPVGFCTQGSITYIRGLEIYARLKDLLGQAIDKSFFEIRPPAEHRVETLKGLLDRLYDGGPGRTTPAYEATLSAVRTSMRAHADNCARILRHNRSKPVPPPEEDRTPQVVERYLELADAYDREADALEAERARIEAELEHRLEALLTAGRGTARPGAGP